MLKGPFLSKDFIGANEDYSTSKIVMLGMPYDCTCSNRAGTRFGPQAMRLESIGIETYSPFFDIEMETAIIGELYNIDAFNQPGVEQAKNYTYALMGRIGYEESAHELNEKIARNKELMEL